MKNLIMYHFYEKDLTYVKNLKFFIEYGLNSIDDFLLIISGKCSFEIPRFSNLNVIWVENKNGDFGGYCHAINGGFHVGEYENYFFINSSMRGPYIPAYVNHDWVQAFLNIQTEETGIVGATINILHPKTVEAKAYAAKKGGDGYLAHVQSAAYLIKKNVFEMLIASGFYNRCDELSKLDLVCDYEIELSRRILSFGYNLKCMLPAYNRIDYRLPTTDINYASKNGDPWCKHGYFGQSIHPYDSIFIKSNRGIYKEKEMDSFRNIFARL